MSDMQHSSKNSDIRMGSNTMCNCSFKYVICAVNDEVKNMTAEMDMNCNIIHAGEATRL